MQISDVALESTHICATGTFARAARCSRTYEIHAHAARSRDRGARTSCTHGSNRITEVTDKSAVVGVPQASSTVWTTAMGVSTLSDVLYVRTPVLRRTHACRTLDVRRRSSSHCSWSGGATYTARGGGSLRARSVPGNEVPELFWPGISI